MKKQKKQRKLRKQATVKGDVGKLLLDIGKLVFGSIFLGGFLKGEIPQSVLVVGGFSVAGVVCLIGLWVIYKGKKSGEF